MASDPSLPTLVMLGWAAVYFDETGSTEGDMIAIADMIEARAHNAESNRIDSIEGWSIIG